MVKWIAAISAILLAAAINLGVYEAGKSDDGYWIVADFGVYLISLFIAGTIIIWASDHG